MSDQPASKTPAGINDTATLRAHARQSIEDGAITESYHADREAVIALLNTALATEYVCTLRYYRHYFMAKGMLADAVKGEFLGHTQQEQAHAHKLAERIVQLGGEPNLNPAPPDQALARQIQGRHRSARHGAGEPDRLTHRHRQLPRDDRFHRRQPHHHQAHCGEHPGPGRRACRRIRRHAGRLDWRVSK